MATLGTTRHAKIAMKKYWEQLGEIEKNGEIEHGETNHAKGLNNLRLVEGRRQEICLEVFTLTSSKNS